MGFFKKLKADAVADSRKNPFLYKYVLLIYPVIFIGDIILFMFNTPEEERIEPKYDPKMERMRESVRSKFYFQQCVQVQKSKGLSTDKCWDML